MIGINSKLTGDMAGSLDKFARDVREKVLLSGVAAMAKVLYDEARLRCPVSDAAHYFYGTQAKKEGVRYYFAPGSLRDAIYRVYSPEKSNIETKTYRISWNHSKVPYGYMVEFGTSNAPAHPFMRPAFSQIQQAIGAGKARMSGKMTEVRLSNK